MRILVGGRASISGIVSGWWLAPLTSAIGAKRTLLLLKAKNQFVAKDPIFEHPRDEFRARTLW